MCEPQALAVGFHLYNLSINFRPEASSVHKVRAIWLAPCRSLVLLILDAAKALVHSIQIHASLSFSPFWVALFQI